MDSIGKLRVKDEDLLKQLIRTHLSFIIDFDFDFNINQNQQKPNKKKLVSNAIFGANLTHSGICCVHQLIEFISCDGNITKEGIFRKSGSVLRQTELKELISSGITVDLMANRFTVHDCCSVLKKFISELPEPLLTESHFELFRRISDINPEVFSPNKSYPKKLTAIQLLLLLIPAPNKQLLRELLTLFEKVILNSESNKMTSSSLATLFAPHLFLPRSFSAFDIQENLQSITSTLIFMIDNSNTIFKAPNTLIRDVDKQLKTIDLMKNRISTSPLAPVVESHQFCSRQNDTSSEDYTANQMAQLYAYLQSMPKSGTPMKKKWIKRFNRENGKGTPLLKQKKSDSTKKSTFGDVLKAGQQFLFCSSEDISKQKINKSLFKDSPIKSEKMVEKQIHKNLTPLKNISMDENISDETSQCLSPISISLENANKKIRLSVRKVGNREPIVM